MGGSRIWAVSWLSAVIFFASCGCDRKYGTHDPGFVAKQWSMTMRELGIVPIFPPREDVQVGDVYVSPVHPEDEHARLAAPGFLPLTVLVTRPDLGAEITSHYQRSSSFPPTPLAPSTQPTLFQQPRGPADSSVFTTGDVGRLRQVGFPIFFSTEISRAGVEAMIPTEAVDVAAGAFASRDAKTVVSVPVAESYGLPAASVLKSVAPFSTVSGLLTLKGAGGETIDGELIADMVRSAKRLKPKVSGGTDERSTATTRPVGYLRLITEVYYARSIDISIQSTQGGSGGLNARLPAMAARTATTQPAAPVKAPATPATMPVYFEHPTPQQVAQSLNEQLGASLANAVPGATFRFLSVSAGGVSMRQTYERPIAIGYRGLTIQVLEFPEKDGRRPIGLRLAGVESGIAPVAAKDVVDLTAVQADIQRTVGERVKTLRPAADVVADDILVPSSIPKGKPLQIQLPSLQPTLTADEKATLLKAIEALLSDAVKKRRIAAQPEVELLD